MSEFHFVHPDELSRPVEGLAINYVDDWWQVDDQGRIAFYVTRGSSRYSHPQCNADESITRRLVENQVTKREAGEDGMYLWAVDVRQIPLVSVPARVSDYQ